jgi:hypothetical protein
MTSPLLDEIITGFSVKGDNSVKKIEYVEKDEQVWINEQQHFSEVPNGIWNFYVGG